MLPSYLIAKTAPKTDATMLVIGEGFRISVLSDRIFRIEKSNTNTFLDEATQFVWFRNFEKPHYTIEEKGSLLTISTDKVALHFNKKLKKADSVTFLDGTIVKCNNSQNLKGTARTLDQTVGKIPLKDGVVSKNGVAILKDDSLILGADGEVKPREKANDVYIFAFGKDFRGAVNGLYKLSGNVPLIPRYALGNWWSRYRAYTQQEYVDLMTRFSDENVPITVATIDMDWHWVDIKQKFGGGDALGDGKGYFLGAGWTGYSWNTDLFPDYKGFLRWLQDRNLKVTLNLHPAQGVRPFEDMYEAMGKELGLPADGKAISFDITSSKYIEAYFKILHTPYEKQGVDFWWIDWQQGKNSKIKGLDPLWSLNHYHYLDSAKDGKLPLILSRYAGFGSHRYPLGFSGDTGIYWSALRFQPYFTANAANVGYTWWSHDIGGHHFGHRDEEMYLRWLQFGVFSPINRLHSTSNDLLGKEPWRYRRDVETFAKQQLCLRHSLIPYLYTMDYRNHSEGLALCEPLYYSYPDRPNAYKFKNQYMFGSQLMVCPIVKKSSKKTGFGRVKAWLPKGRWTDIFTGYVYEGERVVDMFRDEASIPVLAKAGAIIPTAETEGNFCGNPEKLNIWVYRGNGGFKLYEDDGGGAKAAFTDLSVVADGDKMTFKIAKAEGELSTLPKNRQYTVYFKDVADAKISAKVGSKDKINTTGNKICITVDPTEEAVIELAEIKQTENPNYIDWAITVISKLQAGNTRKSIKYGKLKQAKSKQEFVAKLNASLFSREIKQAVLELI